MDELRLYAIVLRLAAIRPGAVPADHGDQVRAALLNIIRASDAVYAGKLHDENAHKPYTISLLQGGQSQLRGHEGRERRDTALHFGIGSMADWRFTLLCEPAFEALLRRYFLSRDLPHVRIGTVEFSISDVFASGRSHHESGHVSVSELYDRWNVPPETLPSTLKLHFASPTAFHLGEDRATKEDRWGTLPTPRLLFSALRKRWLRLGGNAPGDEFDQWVDDQVFAEQFDLRTRRVIVERQPISGVIGHVEYRVVGDRLWLPLIHLLADLTFWTGAGYQTPRGLGQVRRVAAQPMLRSRADVPPGSAAEVARGEIR